MFMILRKSQTINRCAKNNTSTQLVLDTVVTTTRTLSTKLAISRKPIDSTMPHFQLEINRHDIHAPGYNCMTLMPVLVAWTVFNTSR